MTGFKKTDPNRTFGISRITNYNYLTCCESLLLSCGHAKFAVQPQQLFSQCFITINASQLTLLDFEQFFAVIVISLIACYMSEMGRWEGEGWVGSCKQVIPSIRTQLDSSAMSLISDRNRLILQLLAATWYHSNPYQLLMPLSCHKDHVVHLSGLMGMVKRHQ